MKKEILIFICLCFLLSCHKEEGAPTSLPLQENPYHYIVGNLAEKIPLAQALLKLGIESNFTHNLVTHLQNKFDLRYSQPSDSFKLALNDSNQIKKFYYYPDRLRTFIVDVDSNGVFTTTIDSVSLFKQTSEKNGLVQSSLYASMDNAAISPELIVNFTEIFQWDIDFFTETQNGDSYDVIYEQYVNEHGNILKNGNILAATYVNNGEAKNAFRYTNKNGQTGYFNEQGISFQKAFLKSPLNYKRISSRFGNRVHPITKKVRMHNGVDYAASYGTPVEASAGGVVTHVGWLGGGHGGKGGFGKTVKIRHANGYETLYGHLQGFAKGLRCGQKVSQHDVIGYVGSTGFSTGPHLHYTIYEHGKAIDPLRLKNISAPPVTAAEMPAFRSVVDSLKKIQNSKLFVKN